MAGQNDNKLRILLLGLTGVGKSSTGNLIVGKEVFDSHTGTESQTNVCRSENVVGWTIHGRGEVSVCDSPGFFDTKRNKSDVEKQVVQQVKESKPHVFLLLVSVRDRFPEEASETLDRIEELFGQEMYRHTVVLLIGKDYLDHMTLQEFLASSQAHPKVQQLVKKCGDRVAAFNNHVHGQEERQQQVDELKREIEKITDLEEYIYPDGDGLTGMSLSSIIMSGKNYVVNACDAGIKALRSKSKHEGTEDVESNAVIKTDVGTDVDDLVGLVDKSEHDEETTGKTGAISKDRKWRKNLWKDFMIIIAGVIFSTCCLFVLNYGRHEEPAVLRIELSLTINDINYTPQCPCFTLTNSTLNSFLKSLERNLSQVLCKEDGP